MSPSQGGDQQIVDSRGPEASQGRPRPLQHLTVTLYMKQQVIQSVQGSPDASDLEIPD